QDTPGILWSTVSIEEREGRHYRISGLHAKDAATLASAVAVAREETARSILASRADTLAAAANLLHEMRFPQRYVQLSAFRMWLQLAEQCLVGLPARPPSAPDMQDAVGRLKDIQSAVSDPNALRAASNQAFVHHELERMRMFLDQVESRPLTEAQRHA